MLRTICQWAASKLPSVTIFVEGGEKYLTRYYLFGADRKWGNIFLHHFHASDKGLELHNHPWSWSFGLILLGGYREERRAQDNSVQARLVKPGKFNYITNKDFHRVDLLEKDAWSLFVAGPRTQEWGFWDRETKQFRDWKTNPNAIA